MRRILFRADANENIGYGHFFRTLALAEMLKDVFDCCFVTVMPSDYQIKEINKVCTWISLPADNYIDSFISLLEGNEIVVLDNYFFSTENQKQIKNKGCLLVCIDDMHDKHYIADVVINHGIHDSSLFSIEPYTKLCIGYKWALLRKPFLLRKTQRQKSAHKSFNRVVLCFGGSDKNDFTGKFAKVLISMPEVSCIIAIVGDKYVFSENLVSEKIVYKQNLSATEIANIFSGADLAFLSASTICLEAMYCQVEIAAGYYVENQLGFYNELECRGYIYPLGNLFLGDINSKIFQVFEQARTNQVLLFNNNIIEKYRCLFNELCNNRNYFINEFCFIDYVNLDFEQHRDIWQARNDSRIRCWMEHDAVFSLKEHLEFVDNLKVSTNKIYWSVYHRSKLVGSVNISVESANCVERGIFIVPDYFHHALGTKIEKVLMIILSSLKVKRVIAKVMKENERSMLFHLKNGYYITHQDKQYNFLEKVINE